MDFSINSIRQSKIPNFKGIKGDLNLANTPIFRFSAPPYKHDEKPYLEITILDDELDKNCISSSNRYVQSDVLEIDFEGRNTIEIPQEIFEGNKAFAYRYVFKKDDGSERYAIDPFKTVKFNGQEKNIIEIGNNYGVTPKGGAMYHVFIDSVGYNPKDIDENMENFIRTHANKLGGSIKGLTYLLKNGYFDSYKYIISTPDIGADSISPHGYWPINQYQCSNMKDFKDFNFELFKRGMGYVADGAFTSQSLQSPLVQHVLKWGQQSPFYYMLKVDDKMQMGVIPENKEAYNNVGIRLLNSPLKKDYNKNKPTYIQFVDDRLLDDSQRQDTQTPITKYGKPNPDDHYDSVGYQDTTHPFYFEIQNKDFDKKLKCFNKKDYVMLKDLTPGEQEVLFGFAGGDITNRYEAANATFWDGNVDIVKMNLSNPDMSNEKNVKGFNDARNYLYGVATFWTETIQSDLLKRTAGLKPKEIENIVLNSGLNSEEFAQIKANSESVDFESLILKQNKTIDDYIKSFPLQSIETSPELSAIFSEPEFNSELLNDSTLIALGKQLNDVVNSVVPNKYRDNNQYRQYVLKCYANEILKSIYSQAILENSVDRNGNVAIDRLKSEATLKSMLSYTPATVENERKQVVSKIQHEIPKIDNSAITAKIKKELKDISLDNFKLADAVILQTKSGLNWRFDAAKDIGDLTAVSEGLASFSDIWNGTPQAGGVQQFWNEFVTRIKQYNPSSYIIAEITNFGDNIFYKWNDFNSMMRYDEKIANGFIENLRDEILEAEPDSDLAMHITKCSDTSLSYAERKEEFEQALAILNDNGYGNRYVTFAQYENNLPWTKEQDFLQQIGATTSSNYDKYFNNISNFVGVNPENANGGDLNDVLYGRVGRLGYLKENTERLMKYEQPNAVIMSHVFTDNHDKPRVLHTLPLDMQIAVAGLSTKLKQRDITSLEQLNDNDPRKTKIKEITGRNDLANVNPMAAAVGMMMYDKIEKSSLSDDEKGKLKKSLRKFVNGENNGITDARRARAFGFLPYEITIKDLFKDAGIKDKKKIEEFNRLVVGEAMYLQDKMWQLEAALIGVPTLYYGTEYAQSGYETHTKNDLVGNRNRALHERKDKGIFSDFYKKMNAISALSNNPNLSALRNGFPESLEIYYSNDMEMYPIYRKDERNNQVLSIITNFGLKQNTYSKDQGYTFGQEIEAKYVPSIKIENKKQECPFENNTHLKRMVYDRTSGKYITQDVDYIVDKGEIKRKDGKNIEINDTTILFYIKEENSKSKFFPVYNSAH